MSNGFTYSFPALRGIQAEREYYVSMCPMRLIPKIFLFDEEEIQPELRAQRILNKARIPEMSNYLIDNPKGYVFSSITASIDADVEFIPVNDEEFYNIGTLHIPMSARFIINDGQHRRAAIEEALKERPELGDETISIVFYLDIGLERSQQMFADLNRYAIRTTKSLSILYDNRDPLALLTKELIDEVQVFRGLVETEKSSISNRSTKLFTLSGIYHANQELLAGECDNEWKSLKDLSLDFWNGVGRHMKEWQMVKQSDLSPSSLRKDYVHAHSIALMALGRAGSILIEQHPEDWRTRLKPLETIDWHRSNSAVWEGRATIQGRISNSKQNLERITEYLVEVLTKPKGR